ncbi:hypothetical protein ES705_48951 [subsurface metagenome]
MGNSPGYRFPVGNLGLAHAGRYPEFLYHPGYQNIQVQLAHSRDNQLSGIFHFFDQEGWVFLLQLFQGAF